MLEPKLREKLMALRVRATELEGKLSEPAFISSPDYAPALRERGKLIKQLETFERLLKLEQTRDEARAALDDPELRELAAEEFKEAETELERLEVEMTEALSPGRKDDSKDVILEIRAGTGGEEAALFAADLLRMYTRFAENRGWKVEPVSASASEAGGLKEAVVSIQGENVFRDLKHEGGGHRVQRVPETETQGRIHTSAATVAVLPEAEEYEVEIKPGDLDIATCRSGGPGGQNVNKTDSAVHMVHIPTGITVHMQDEKSQHKNRAKALRIMRSRLYEHYQSLIDAERADSRRTQTGSGDRSERIRTYNFPQNRCTDHRLGKNFSLDRIVEGGLEKLVEELVVWGRQQELARS